MAIQKFQTLEETEKIEIVIRKDTEKQRKCDAIGYNVQWLNLNVLSVTISINSK